MTLATHKLRELFSETPGHEEFLDFRKQQCVDEFLGEFLAHTSIQIQESRLKHELPPLSWTVVDKNFRYEFLLVDRCLNKYAF
jgi:hypothetical protein